MLYPLSYRRAGQARNVVENRARIATGSSVGVLVGPVRRRSGLSGPVGAGSAYRCARWGCTGSPSGGLVSVV